MPNFSPNIGRVLGIDVQLHWTFVVLILLGFLASMVYPQLFILFIAFVLLFVCVFIHELFHSITAIRNKIRIKKIILLPLGGASVIDNTEDITPETEFRISIVGPIASIVLGLIFGIIVIYTPAGAVKQIVQFLFVVNILLGVFNIMPAFPLDGGRVLRSYLQKKRDIIHATKTSIKISNIFIVLFLVFTVVYAALANGYSFVYREFIVFFDIFIALYLYDGAKAELQSVYVKEYASKLKVEAAVSKNFVVVKPSTTPYDLYKTILKSKTHIVIVKDKNEIKVIPRLTKFSGFKNAGEMSKTIPVLDSNAPLTKALDVMGNKNVGIVAVTNRKRLVGVVLAQHAESIIGLYISKRLAEDAAA